MKDKLTLFAIEAQTDYERNPDSRTNVLVVKKIQSFARLTLNMEEANLSLKIETLHHECLGNDNGFNYYNAFLKGIFDQDATGAVSYYKDQALDYSYIAVDKNPRLIMSILKKLLEKNKFLESDGLKKLQENQKQAAERKADGTKATISSKDFDGLCEACAASTLGAVAGLVRKESNAKLRHAASPEEQAQVTPPLNIVNGNLGLLKKTLLGISAQYKQRLGTGRLSRLWRFIKSCLGFSTSNKKEQAVNAFEKEMYLASDVDSVLKAVNGLYFSNLQSQYPNLDATKVLEGNNTYMQKVGNPGRLGEALELCKTDLIKAAPAAKVGF